MKPISPLLLVCAATILLLVGCGESGSDTPKTVTVVETTAAPASTALAVDTQADKALARASLLQLSDMPVGWTSSSNEQSRIGCPAFAAVRRMPRAESPDFAHGDEQFASQAVAVYPTPQDVDDAIDHLLAPRTRDCLAKDVEKRFSEDPEADGAVGDVTVSQLNVEPLGQRSAALRVQVAISSSGIDADVYADFVFSQVGRGLTMSSIGSSYTEPDEELRAMLAQRAVQRLSEQLDRA